MGIVCQNGPRIVVRCHLIVPSIHLLPSCVICMVGQGTHRALLYFKSATLNCHCEKPTGIAANGRHYRSGRHRWIKQIIVKCHWAGQAVVF